MITGDHKDTATAIARDIGILPRDTHIDDDSNHREILTGQELEELSEEEYNKIAKDIKVYARVYPEQKGESLRYCKTMVKLFQ
jgi:Ca2+-transporting ATPase